MRRQISDKHPLKYISIIFWRNHFKQNQIKKNGTLALQHIKWSSLWQLLTAGSCELLSQGVSPYKVHGCWICSGNRQNRFMQLTSKHFCDNFLKQSKTFYTTLPRSKPSSLSSISNIAFKTHYVFFAIAGQVKQSCVCNASNASNVSIPMLQMKVCFLWTPWKEFKVHLESKLFWNKPSLFLRWHQL